MVQGTVSGFGGGTGSANACLSSFDVFRKMRYHDNADTRIYIYHYGDISFVTSMCIMYIYIDIYRYIRSTVYLDIMYTYIVSGLYSYLLYILDLLQVCLCRVRP